MRVVHGLVPAYTRSKLSSALPLLRLKFRIPVFWKEQNVLLFGEARERVKLLFYTS